MRRNAYIVYTRTSGGAYLTERARRITGFNFRWEKNRAVATKLPKDVAIRVANRYGGVAVRA